MTYTKEDALDLYDRSLNDDYDIIEIRGNYYNPADTLKLIDPKSYEIGFDDFCRESCITIVN